MKPQASAPNHISLPSPPAIPPPTASANLPLSSSVASAPAAHASLLPPLAALGLQQYIPACERAGLTLESLSQLSEAEFERLGISIGHRRKLQRAFARGYGWEDDRPLPSPEEWRDFRDGGGVLGEGESNGAPGRGPMLGGDARGRGMVGEVVAETRDASREWNGDGRGNGEGMRGELGARVERERTYTPEGRVGGGLETKMRLADLGGEEEGGDTVMK